MLVKVKSLDNASLFCIVCTLQSSIVYNVYIQQNLQSHGATGIVEKHNGICNVFLITATI